MSEDVFNGNGVRISLNEPDDFNKIRESLTRIGIPSRDKTLWQSCHILHRQGQYAILHFKEMFQQDGKTANIDEEDYSRRNRIALLLEEWGLCKIIDREEVENTDKTSHLGMIKVISYKDKENWDLKPKYMMRSEYKKRDA